MREREIDVPNLSFILYIGRSKCVINKIYRRVCMRMLGFVDTHNCEANLNILVNEHCYMFRLLQNPILASNDFPI